MTFPEQAAGFLRTHAVQAARYSGFKHRITALLKTDRPADSDGKAEITSEFLRQARSGAHVPVQY